MKTEIVKLTQMTVNGANPRTITDEKFHKLVNSILVLPKMLELRPIVVDNTMVILGGNMRYRALTAIADMSEDDIAHRLSGLRDFQKKTEAERKLLLEHWARWKDGPTAHVIKASELSDAEQREFTIKDNVGFGSWDMDALANEWDSQDLDDWGLDVWQDDMGGENTSHDDEFDETEIEGEPCCILGDIWRLGKHRLMCGDSANTAHVEALMDGEKADMVFTDPPYGVAIGDKNKTLAEVTHATGSVTKNIKNDNISPDELYKILVAAMTNARNACKRDACYFVTSPQVGELGVMMMMMMKDAGLPVRHILIWEKNCATFSLGRLDYDYQHEPIFYTWTESHHNYRGGENRTTIWKYNKPQKCDLHPTMKPVELVANAMMDGTKDGDIVLDLFGGSGTTMIAGEQMNRSTRLMELDPHYCDVIIARWEKQTGLKAEKIKNINEQNE